MSHQNKNKRKHRQRNLIKKGKDKGTLMSACSISSHISGIPLSFSLLFNFFMLVLVLLKSGFLKGFKTNARGLARTNTLFIMWINFCVLKVFLFVIYHFMPRERSFSMSHIHVTHHVTLSCHTFISDIHVTHSLHA